MFSLILLILLFLSCLFLRILWVRPTHPSLPRKTHTPFCKTCIVLGSGGHTAEMFVLLTKLDVSKFRPRMYIIAESDVMSEGKAREFERKSNATENCDFHVYKVPRSREVGQSWWTTPWTVWRTLAASLKPILVGLPDVIVCNGPGSCVPICLLAYIPRILGVKKIHIIYVESFARVKTLSMSGRILYPWADRFIVQWKGLTEKYNRAEWYGTLV